MLVVSYLGYVTKEIEVGNQTEFEIILVENVSQLDEVVVVGFGTQKKSQPASADLTSAGSVIYHQSVRVEPVGNSPIAGILTDLSEREFVYKLVSADGTTHDWFINIVVQ